MIISLCILTLVILYYNLDIGQDPVPADIVIVNEGGFGERAKKAVELLEVGYVDKIMISPADEYLLERYYKLGAQPEDIIHETQATTTWTNAKYSLALMKEQGYQSALVVSSDYHMRRVRLVYERLNQDYNFQLTYVSAYPLEDGKPVPYHQHPYNWRIALNELWKFPGYFLGLYHFSPKNK